MYYIHYHIIIYIYQNKKKKIPRIPIKCTKILLLLQFIAFLL